MTTITELAISNLLSFDEKGVRVTLRPLTVLIGANGSGKRNFLQILARSQKHLLPVQDQVWRHQGSDPGTTASVETVLRMSKSSRTIRRRVNYTTNGAWLEPTTNGYRTEDNAAIDSHDANESSRFHEQLFRSRETEVAEQESAAYTLRTLPAKQQARVAKWAGEADARLDNVTPEQLLLLLLDAKKEPRLSTGTTRFIRRLAEIANGPDQITIMELPESGLHEGYTV